MVPDYFYVFFAFFTTPGADLLGQSSMGRQCLSRCRTAPGASLSGRNSFGSTITKAAAGPGPGAYAIWSPLENATCAAVFGHEDKRGAGGVARGHGTPGPGEYAARQHFAEHFHTLGAQSGGHRPSQDPRLLRSDLSAFVLLESSS